MMANSPLAASATITTTEVHQAQPRARRVGKKHRNKERHQPLSGGLAATPCVFSLIETTTSALVVKTTPFVNGSVVRHREALRRAKVLKAKDPTTLEIESGAYDEDFEADSRLAALECRQETRTFEERGSWSGLGVPSPAGKQKEEEWCLWSPDARALSEAAAAMAAQPGGMGAGPRLTLEDVFLNFRELNLTKKNITTIDQAFVHFTNLRKLDLGRNGLTALANLPTGLVALSCAANELSGRALDNVADLPLLSALDLSYNSLDVGSFLPEATHRNTTVGEIISGSGGGVFYPRVGADRLFHEKFAALEHLDLSWNVLCDIGGIMDTLRPLQPTLRHLFLSGNPLSMLPSYRARVLSDCGPLLGVLDDLRVTPEERATAAREVRCTDDMRGSGRREGTQGTTVGFDGAGEACSKRGAGGDTTLDMVHFEVKILRLSNLPCIDDVEVNDSEVDGGGGGAIEAPRGKGGVAPTPNDDEREDYQPPRQWGEVELHIPGNDGTLKSTPFSWASEVVPATNDETPAETENNPAAAGGGVVSPTSNHHVEGGSEEEVWEFGVVVPPSKAVRDGVRFRGLNIFLYGVDETAVDEGEKQYGEMEHATVFAESASEITQQRGKAAASETPDSAGGAREGGQAYGEGTNRGTTENPELRPRRRRRRLVGQASLPLSSLLDAQWMWEQALRRKRRSKGVDFATAEAENEEEGKPPIAADTSTEITGAADGGAGMGDNEHGPCSDSAGKDGVSAVISETCELSLESWVASLAAGVASVDSNGVVGGAAEQDDGPADADDIMSPLPAAITVEVTLNSHESMMRGFPERYPP